MAEGKIIGIDLGTTNSAAAVLEGGRPVIIPSAEGPTLAGKMFPSVVAFTKEGNILVGDPASRQAATNPDRTIQHIKRKMGTDYKVKVGDKVYTPQQISAFILQKIKKDSESFLSEEIEKAVITVPAYFNDNQRTATKDAGTIAGLEVVRIINEPTAASLAFGLDKEDQELKIAVLDLGGGTFDVTIMQMGEGVFQVKSTSGDTSLGGKDMDDKIVEWVVKKFKKKEGVDLKKDHTSMERIREAAEKAKIELSNVPSTTINLPFITAKDNEPVHLETELTRSKLEELIDPILDKLEKPVKNALKDANLGVDDIDKVILVGGPTRMPSVQETFTKVLDTDPERGVDPMECVAVGAALQGGVIAGEVKDILLLDVTPLSLGVETLGGVFTKLIERNTAIPTKKTEVFSTAADHQTTVEIHALQGERASAQHNISLGKFMLHDIPPAPRGVPQIEVTFDIDANGILNVSAKDKATGNEKKITITSATKMGDDDIEDAVEEAEKHAEEDEKRLKLVNAKNRADSLLYTSKKTLKQAEEKGKLEKDEKKKVEEATKALEKAMEGEDVEEINSKTDELLSSLDEVSKRLYQDMAGGAGPGSASQGPGQTAGASAGEEEKKKDADEKVVDADYKVIDEEDKD